MLDYPFHHRFQLVLHDIPVLERYRDTQLLKSVRYEMLLVPVL